MWLGFHLVLGPIRRHYVVVYLYFKTRDFVMWDPSSLDLIVFRYLWLRPREGTTAFIVGHIVSRIYPLSGHAVA